MARLEWTVDYNPPEREPEPTPVCALGIKGHTWHLSIEEGQVTLSPVEPCPLWFDMPVCSHAIDTPEILGMAPIVVRLDYRVETYGYYEVEHDVFIDIVPVEAS